MAPFGRRKLQYLRMTAYVATFFAIVCIVLVVRAAQVTIDDTANGTAASHDGSSPTTVFVSGTVGYVFYVDSDGTCVYSKTSDGGDSWGSAVTVDAQTDCIRVAVWYDRWTPGDGSGTYIHIATIDSGGNDVWYTRLDTSGDALTTTVNISDTTQDGSFAAGANIHSITKATDGDLYIGILDNSDSFVLLCDNAADCTSDANWGEAGSVNPFPADPDWIIIVPLASGDIMAIWWDLSANSIQSNVYHDETDLWDVSWATVDASAAENGGYKGAYGATVDRSTHDIYLVYTADVSSFGTDDDIRSAVYSGGTWTAKTDVLTDETRGITGTKIAYDEVNDFVYALYSARTTSGAGGSGNVYYKRSIDGMTSWGSENGPLNTSEGNVYGARMNLMSSDLIYAQWFITAGNDLFGSFVVDVTLVPPATPTNSAPANGATGQSLTPTLSASAFSDPNIGDTHANSEWQVSTVSDDFSSPVYDSGTTASNLTSIAIPSATLSASTTYYWRVRYQDNTGTWSGYSTNTSFTTSIAPTTPVNATPADSAVDVSVTPTFSASAFSDSDVGHTHATTEWQVDDNSAFSAPEWTRTSVSGETSIVVNSTNGTFVNSRAGKTSLSHDTVYYWRARYRDSTSVWSEYSTSTSFTTNALSTPTHSSPTDGSTVVTLTPLLIASDFDDDEPGHTHTGSEWQVDNNSDFSSVLYDSGTVSGSSVSHAVPSGQLSNHTTYYWRVRYQDSEDDFSSYSTSTSFTIDMPETSVLILPLFGNTTVDQGDSVHIDVQIKNFSDGSPITNASSSISIYNPSGVKVVDNASMTYVSGSLGIYRYTYPVASTSGTFLYEVTAEEDDETGYGAANFEVRTIQSDLSDIATDVAEIDTVVSTTNAISAAITLANQNIDMLLGGLILTQSTISDISPTATSFDTALTNATDDFYKNAVLTFTSGDLNGQSRRISGYNGTTNRITISPALTSAPADGDTFTITKQHVYVEQQIEEHEAFQSAFRTAVTSSLASLHEKADELIATVNTVDTNIDTIQSVVNDIRTSQERPHTVQLSNIASIESGATYRSKLTLTDFESNPKDAVVTSTITIYDASRSVVVSATVMDRIGMGVYEYTYPISSAATGGIWEAVVSVDLGGDEEVTRNDYFRVTGSPAEVFIEEATDTTLPEVAVRARITNEGSAAFEYEYEWCAVTEESNPCGGGDDAYYASAAKLIGAGESFVTTLPLTLSTPGTYTIKLVVYFGEESSAASIPLVAVSGEAGEVLPPGGGAPIESDETEVPVSAPQFGDFGEVFGRDLEDVRAALKDQSVLLTQALALFGEFGGTRGFGTLLTVNEENTGQLKDIQNKISDLRTVSTLVRRLAGERSDLPLVETYMKFNSVEIHFVIVNPKETADTIKFKAYLPEEVKPEHVIDSDGLILDYDIGAGAYFVAGDITLGPGESTTRRVEMKDIWIISEEDMRMIVTEADGLTLRLQGGKQEKSARVLLAEIKNLFLQIIRRQEASYTSPQDHILVYRENLELKRIVEKKLEELRQMVADIGTVRESNTLAFLTSINGTVMIALGILVLLLGVFVFHQIHVMQEIKEQLKQKAPKKRRKTKRRTPPT